MNPPRPCPRHRPSNCTNTAHYLRAKPQADSGVCTPSGMPSGRVAKNVPASVSSVVKPERDCLLPHLPGLREDRGPSPSPSHMTPPPTLPTWIPSPTPSHMAPSPLPTWPPSPTLPTWTPPPPFPRDSSPTPSHVSSPSPVLEMVLCLLILSLFFCSQPWRALCSWGPPWGSSPEPHPLQGQGQATTEQVPRRDAL